VRSVVPLNKNNNDIFIKALITALYFAFSLQATIVSANQNKQAYIKLGMSNVLTGPAKELGQNLKQGSLAYFKRINESGGIHGKQITIISLDDGYEPHYTVENTLQLIEDEQVLALFGYVGTPTSFAILPLLTKTKTPYLMPFTGADFLRSPVTSNIFNLRASYFQEARAQVDYLVNKLKLKNIALIIQADEFGLSAQRAFISALNQYNVVPVVNARFKRNSTNIAQALTELKKTPVDAVIFVGTYQPFSQLINLAHQQSITPLFTSLSFIASQSLFSRLKHPSKIMISEVMPDPHLCEWQLCKWFIDDMNKAGVNSVNRVQLEGYLNAFVFSQAAKNCTVELTPQCLLEKLENFTFKDKDLDIKFSADNHQGLQQTYFSFSDAAKNFR